MEPAIVEVAFEVVEGVANIDPINSVQYLTWGYRVQGDDQVISGSSRSHRPSPRR